MCRREGQAALGPARGLEHRVARVGQHPDDGLGARLEGGPGGGERDLPGGAADQRGAERVL